MTQSALAESASEFAGKVALVTGGATGIGFACARRFARGGTSVVLCGNEAEPLASACETLASQGLVASCRVADVAVGADVEAAVGHAVEQFGGLDIIVNSAAIQPYGSVAEMDEATWDRVLAVNLKSIYLAGHHGIPRMEERGGGAIVNIASVQGIACQSGVAAYAASKGAVLALTRAMALDHASAGIRVNAVCPGSVDTPMLRFAADENRGERSTDEVIASWGRMHPLGRVGHADDVAEMVAFLAGPRGAFCTGGEYKVDGGLLAKLGVVLPES